MQQHPLMEVQRSRDIPRQLPWEQQQTSSSIRSSYYCITNGVFRLVSKKKWRVWLSISSGHCNYSFPDLQLQFS
ncbi:unnamed protein product [Urochloa humidicola]